MNSAEKARKVEDITNRLYKLDMQRSASKKQEFLFYNSL